MYSTGARTLESAVATLGTNRSFGAPQLTYFSRHTKHSTVRCGTMRLPEHLERNYLRSANIDTHECAPTIRATK